jgi:hypothetical protein
MILVKDASASPSLGKAAPAAPSEASIGDQVRPQGATIDRGRSVLMR